MSDETTRPDYLARFLAIAVAIALGIAGAVHLIGERPVRIAGEILSWMFVAAIVAAPVVYMGIVTYRFFAESRWASRERAVSLRRESYIVNSQPGFALVGNVASNSWKHFSSSKSGKAGKDDAPRIEAPTQPPGDALALTDDCERGAIFGGTGAGKTHLARAMAARRLAVGEIVVAIDPKPVHPDRMWPRGTRLAGPQMRIEEMEAAFEWIDAEAGRRGEDYENVDSYPKVTVFFDEVNVVLENNEHLATAYLRILRLYREYGISCWIIGQSDRAASVGMKGKNDLKQCFDVIARLRFNRISGERAIELDYQTGETPIACPAISIPAMRRGAGARAGMGWAVEGGEGYSGRSDTPRHTPKHTHTECAGYTGRNTPGSTKTDVEDVFDAEIVSESPCRVPRIPHYPGMKPFVFSGRSVDPEIIEVSDPDIARIIRAVRATPPDASIRELCRAAGRTPGGRQAERIKRLIREHAPRMYRDRFGR